MAETDQADAREAGRLAIREAAADSRRRQRYGLLAALAAALTAACVPGDQGHEAAAAPVGGGTVVGLAAAFITGRRGRGS